MVRLGYDGEMSIITEGIYISRYRAVRDQEFLRQNGITHVINCASSSCNSLFKDSFTYLDLPLKDEPKSDEEIFKPLTPLESFIPSASLFIQECLDNGGRVVVHCRKGVSRSVAIVAGYLMFGRGASLTQALTLVRERRKAADPNVWFVEDLEAYQLKLQTDRLNRARARSGSHNFLTVGQVSSETQDESEDKRVGCCTKRLASVSVVSIESDDVGEIVFKPAVSLDEVGASGAKSVGA
uniref:Protein-serine/threonine phosphatase n=1 Tax=Mucochytrium quahogii TaxID=96639 RepID=A0A7S2RZQ4_9STRA|mmetsp:Transcript_3521/g.5095  ORF Transcript_3521/g.5095 Transcript_3521/m.5095 type:complete len:239 (+) Transcript_3521:261-977(+)|eukprot:CAMPEP_0203780050 /NCGR_PEP_ID=MMETSP0099_2-20121227/9146_1 /ASSEMBLY_ACC=CAM_ASM_000209 /TAXON_ID=96639 /ORGANISM=" , Strain NY0313808BC1" /LENGTH=238 /DNA_ID=CAMNT_0050680245 /DNA_START=436 /DNA_END=1152 /DNA_ORIENTATION=-